jgi:hypothetical protein
MEQHLGSSIVYRIAVGPQQRRKVFPLQTLPACEEPFDVERRRSGSCSTRQVNPTMPAFPLCR